MKMKLLILFAALAYASGAVVQNAARSNLNEGWINPGDQLLFRHFSSKSSLANEVQTQDVFYRGSYNTRITAVQASEVGNSKYAQAYIIAGGIGSNNVTVRLQTARGYGYEYLVEIWGR